MILTNFIYYSAINVKLIKITLKIRKNFFKNKFIYYSSNVVICISKKIFNT